MPRQKTTISTVKRRKETVGKYRLKNQYDFVDAFPEIHGTLPEKMVYNALTNMGIPFLFLNDISFNDPNIDFYKTYQADFIIPATKVIIEVQGSFWHSKPTAIEADAYKMAVYESFGYKALAWWDYEIYTDLARLITQEPLLTVLINGTPRYGRSTELPVVTRTKVDTSQGIRTMNARKKKPYRKANQVSRKTLRKVQSSYATK